MREAFRQKQALRFTRELKASQCRGKMGLCRVDDGVGCRSTFLQRQNLKTAAKHFWMQKRLKSAFCFHIGFIRKLITKQFRQDAGDEVMLIGEACDV